MELLLVRHAVAFDPDSHRWSDDRQRPLSPAGIARARKAAAGLQHLVEPPDRALSSPLVRAWQTAQILAQYAAWPNPEVCAALTPEQPPVEVLAVLASQRATTVAVIGHQPQLGQLLAACLSARTHGDENGGAFKFRKMGVALVSFEGMARAGGGTLQWFVPPRIRRSSS
jgi:phosphohistidine phosphatase